MIDYIVWKRNKVWNGSDQALDRDLVPCSPPAWNPGHLCPQVPSALLAMGPLNTSTCLCQISQTSEEDICSLPAWLSIQGIEFSRRNKYLAGNNILNPWLSVALQNMSWEETHLWRIFWRRGFSSHPTQYSASLVSARPPESQVSSQHHFDHLPTSPICLHCISFTIYHWLLSSSVKKKGLKDLIAFTLKLLKYLAHYII